MEIETALKQNKSDDIVIILADFNAKVGCTRPSDCVGSYGLGETNETGDALITFCEQHKFSVVNTFFLKPEKTSIHLEKPWRCHKEPNRLYTC